MARQNSTVRESGMFGAKNLDYSRIASKSCIVLDSSGGPNKIITAAPGQNKIRATITGRRAHAGLAHETGISAIQVAANAVAAMQLLRIDEETTCNIGTLKGEGPTLIECKTYRWRGHWTGDPEVYRTREEVEDWKENRDPIKLFGAYMVENGLATQEELDKIAADVAKKMEDAVEFAMNSPEPDPAHVLDDVFYEG